MQTEYLCVKDDGSQAVIKQHNAITCHMSAYVSKRQHTSAYVSIRQHASAHGSQTVNKQHNAITCRDALAQHASAYASIRQHTQHTLKQHASIRLGDDLPQYARPADAPEPRPPA
jgi:hypothetical protein